MGICVFYVSGKQLRAKKINKIKARATCRSLKKSEEQSKEAAMLVFCVVLVLLSWDSLSRTHEEIQRQDENSVV